MIYSNIQDVEHLAPTESHLWRRRLENEWICMVVAPDGWLYTYRSYQFKNNIPI